MKVPDHVLKMLRENPQMLRLPLEPIHGWRSSPDEGGHTHCASCKRTIYRGDPVVGCYLKYVSTVFCPACVADNPELFREWLAGVPGLDDRTQTHAATDSAAPEDGKREVQRPLD